MKIFGHISFWGVKFSPARAECEIGCSFTKKNELGEIGTIGKYKGKPYDYGASSINFECDNEGDFFLVPAKILDFLRLNKEKFKALEAEEIKITVNIAYQKQCNIELAPSFMKIVADLEVPLILTCYESSE